MKMLMEKILSVRNLHSSPVCGAVLSAAVAALSMVCPAAFSGELAAPRECVSLDAGWRFIQGDPDDHRSQGYVCAKSQAFK